MKKSFYVSLGMMLILCSFMTWQNVKAETIPSPPSDSLDLTKVFSTGTIQGSGSLINGNTALKITDSTNQKSSIWSKKKLDFSNKFTIKSFVYFGLARGDAGDGITLTFQDQGQSVIGDSGQNLGAYKGNLGSNALSLEFDTYYNGDGLDSWVTRNSNAFQNQHMAFINHGSLYTHNGLSYIPKSYLPSGLSDGSWKRVTLDWDPTTNIMSYELGSTLPNTLPIATGSYQIDPTRFSNKQAYWGYTGSTGAAWASNAVAFQGVPQAQVQEISLSKSTILEEDTTTLTVNQTTVSGSWSNRKVVIDWNTIGSESLEYVPGTLVVDGQIVTPEVNKDDGTLTINKLTTLSSNGTDTSSIELQLKGLQKSDLKNITVRGYGTNEYDDDFPKTNDIGLEIKQAPITAEAVDQSLLLGNDVKNIESKSLVKNVKVNGVASTNYSVQLLNPISTDIVGIQTIQAKVTSYIGKSKYEVIVDVKITVNWGNTIQIKGNNYETVMGLALVNEANQLNIIATSGEINSGSIHPNQSSNYLTISQYTEINGPLNTSNPSFKKDFLGTQTKAYARQQIGSLSAAVGNILSIQHVEVTKWKEMISLYTDSVKSTPYKEDTLPSNLSYYELTSSGYNLLYLNQLTTKSGSVPIYSSNDYLDLHASEYIDLKGHSNITVKGFSQYPNTKISGSQPGKIIVEEVLSTGKKAQYEYDVTVNVESGSLSYFVPENLVFKDFSKSSNEQIIQRKVTSNIGLSIKDNRGANSQGNWTLTAQIKNKTDRIAPYLVYRDEHGADSYLDDSAVPIYTKAKQSNALEPLEVEVSDTWKTSTGLLLKVPSKNNLSSQSYSSTITWNLAEGP